MNRRWLGIICLGCFLLACSPQESSVHQLTQEPPPTPDSPVLQVSSASTTGALLRVTLPSIKLLKRPADDDTQLFLIMADALGTYTYLLYPANRSGDIADQFDLAGYSLDLSVDENTRAVTLWILAVHNTRYGAAETFGLDALASSLALGFSNWLGNGDSTDDPLAAVVSASGGALFEWFACIDVLGQNLILFRPEDNWGTGLRSSSSADGGLIVVYTVQYLSAEDTAQIVPTATLPPMQENYPGYTLIIDETFAGGTSPYRWYQGSDETYANHLINGAYEIQLTALTQRNYGLSWGSMEGERFKNYIVEAQVSLLEENVTAGKYGIWFNYQDDYNFIYFGISNTGQYRAAVFQDNNKKQELQVWTSSPIIRTGAATNILTIEANQDGSIVLGVNGEQLAMLNDQTFTSGSIAFFCYAESVPTTCRLEHLRVWQRTD
jgi:hypothetical protein